MRKKILILANLDIGLYKFRKELIQELQKEGGEVYLSLPYGEGNYVERFKEKGCQFFNTCVDRRGMNPVKDGKLFLRYWNMMRKVRPDQVITYTIKPNIYGGMADWNALCGQYHWIRNSLFAGWHDAQDSHSHVSISM